MRKVVVSSLVSIMLALGVAACSSEPSSSDAHRGHRVFFVSPKNGATITPMSTFEFGSEGTTISPVPPGELKPEQVRPGMTHYHLGVDTDCLPPGQVIPKADPWIHFGKGDNRIEMSMTPGPHKLVLQSGDDMHRTVEGLCETINVTVAQ